MSTSFASRRPLRKDPRGWQIEDDATAEGALEALEAAGLIVLELLLHRIANLHTADDPTRLALRGLGTAAGRTGMSRLAWITGVDELGRRRSERAPTEEARAAGDAMRRVLNWLLAWDLGDIDQPPTLRRPTSPPPAVRIDLDELHAVITYLDRRSTSQGMAGPGRRRNMQRQTTRRSS